MKGSLRQLELRYTDFSTLQKHGLNTFREMMCANRIDKFVLTFQKKIIYILLHDAKFLPVRHMMIKSFVNYQSPSLHDFRYFGQLNTGK